MTNVSAGDTVMYRPKNGGVFPTGEKERSAFVETVRDEITVRQTEDKFTNRIKNDQVVCVCSGGAD